MGRWPRQAMIRGVVRASVVSLALGLLAVPTANTAHAQDEAPTDPGPPRVEAGVAPGAGVPDPRPGEAFADSEVATLQQTANQVQRELGELANKISSARDRLRAARRQLSEARAERKSAERALVALRDEIDELSRSAYIAMGRPDELSLLLSASGPKEMLAGSSIVSYLRDGQDKKLTKALDRLRTAEAAEAEASRLESEAAERENELVGRSDDATNRADAVSSELRDPIATANEAVAAQQKQQAERNRKTKKNWQRYLNRLDKAGITPPRASALRDPDTLPPGLDPLRGDDGDPQRGVAQASNPMSGGDRLLVLPKQTIDAVSDAIDALGKPYVPREHGTGPTSYSCDGLVNAVYSDAGLDQPRRAARQYATGRRVPVDDVQPGDLVFAGPAKYGVQHVGIALDDETMLAADGRLATVAVTDLPGTGTLLGVTRPSLGDGKKRRVPKRDDGELTWRCGGVELPLRTSSESGGGHSHPGATGAWGGYPNGLIPSSALCGIGIGSHALRCDAAQSFAAMSRAHAADTGSGLCVTDSYRSFPAQVDLYRRKPSLAAVPGTSNHGWGIAIDMCGGVESFGTAAHRWMQANAPAFGWIHPSWARQGGGREEPWHWEYVGR
ncbi:D-alanyl-D-alanine carboxypeptidase family protein [Haloechinothrix halophila]|uniref:D-alanyl-D-alanine carboxypeptidase family protein n=1 Tax=Haloechinothrix halophila TaxID=1069073 RepID=UPI0003F6D0A5|nr:D-alanyl-D-alanine carboxypeptidase family protein [Haloechinothrix halophila]